MLYSSPAILTRFLPVGPATLSSNAPEIGGHIFKNEVQTEFRFVTPCNRSLERFFIVQTFSFVLCRYMLLSLASVIVLQEFVADHYSSTQGDILIFNTPTTEILVMTMSLDITVQNQECQIDEQCKYTSNSTSILTSAQVSRTNADDLGKIRERTLKLN